MIQEKDIELVENYFFGKLTEQEKIAFEQRIKTDKLFAEEVDFIHDLKISANELGKKELRAKLKAIANNYNVNESSNTKDFKFYLAIAASVIFLLGIGSLIYLFQSKNVSEITASKINNRYIEIESIINTSLINIKQYTVKNITEEGMGYVQNENSFGNNKLPVLIIKSNKYCNKYLYRDTLFLFIESTDSLQFTSLNTNPNILFFSSYKKEFFSIDVSKTDTLRPIQKISDEITIKKLLN